MKLLMEQKEYEDALLEARTSGNLKSHHSFIEALYNETMGNKQPWGDNLPTELSEKFWIVIRKLREKSE